jgi:hypothetical protein
MRMTHPGCAFTAKDRIVDGGRCAKMLVATAMTTTLMVVAAAAVTKTQVAIAVLWVVAHPCFFVRLACKGDPKRLPTAKWGLSKRSCQDLIASN